MSIIIVSIEIATILVTCYFLFRQKNQIVENKTPILFLREPFLTAIFGLFLWFEANVIFYFFIISPERIVLSFGSSIAMLIYFSICMILGAVMILYFFKQSIAIFKENIIQTNILGNQKIIAWRSISSIHYSIGGKRITLISGKDRLVLRVNRAEMKIFKTFVEKQTHFDTDSQ